MTALLNSVVSPRPAVSDRDQLLSRSRSWFDQARELAEDGNIAESAQLILKALGHERRAGSVGPQVMQIIKPRPSSSNWGNRS